MRSGVFLILLSMSLTPFGDALSKSLGAAISPFFIVFLRYLTGGIIALVVVGLSGSQIYVPRRDWISVTLRTAYVMAAMTLLILSLSMIPLANAVGGFLIAPVVAILISSIVYGERLTVPRIAGTLVSFLGAALVLRPDAGLNAGMLLALSGGGFLGMFLATTGAASQIGNPVSALAVQCILGSAMLAPFALPYMQALPRETWGPIAGLGVVTAATHFLTVAAYRRAESAQLAPFFYFNLVAAVIVGMVWFQEVPGLISIVGLSAIAAGGLISMLPRDLYAKVTLFRKPV